MPLRNERTPNDLLLWLRMQGCPGDTNVTNDGRMGRMAVPGAELWQNYTFFLQ